MPPDIKTAYLASKGFEDHLVRELDGIRETRGRLILTDQPARPVFWAQNIWLNPAGLPIQSIADGARKLKALQRNWCLYSTCLHRRASLIRDQLPHVSAKPLSFPCTPPEAPLGSWTLWDADTILASTRCSSPFPNGEAVFREDRDGPPNRAYLKLWEALTRLGGFPRRGEFCIDAGAAPGGWTWAIQKLGARVLCVDRSPLHAKIAALPGVEFQKRSAFSLKPGEFKNAHQSVDWLFCDVICYPEKLYDWISTWIDSGLCKNIVCTLKFQGDYDQGVAGRFASIPGGRLIHLYHNKHELTWIFRNR